jgi:hypothetical protein
VEGGEALLELIVRRHVAGDEPRGPGADAPALQRLRGGGDDVGMGGEAQVVVGAEQQDVRAGERDPRPDNRSGWLDGDSPRTPVDDLIDTQDEADLWDPSTQLRVIAKKRKPPAYPAPDRGEAA